MNETDDAKEEKAACRNEAKPVCGKPAMQQPARYDAERHARKDLPPQIAHRKCHDEKLRLIADLSEKGTRNVAKKTVNGSTPKSQQNRIQ